MSYCANCGLVILEPNQNYGINPEAVCKCCQHDRRVLTPPSLPANDLQSRVEALQHRAERAEAHRDELKAALQWALPKVETFAKPRLEHYTDFNENFAKARKALEDK